MNQPLNEQLRQLRRQQGLTQEQLAQRINVSRQTVSHWENGRAAPDYEALRLLAEALGVTVARLLGEEDAPLPEAGSAILLEEAAPAEAAAPARRSLALLPWIAAGLFLCLCLALLWHTLFPAPPNAPDEEWFAASSPRVEGSGYVDIVAYQTPVPRKPTSPGSPYCWEHSVFFREENGVATTIDLLEMWVFYENGQVNHQATPGPEILWGAHSHSRIRAGSSREYIIANGSQTPIRGIGLALTCTDEAGHSLVFRKYIPYGMQEEK